MTFNVCLALFAQEIFCNQNKNPYRNETTYNPISDQLQLVIHIKIEALYVRQGVSIDTNIFWNGRERIIKT